MGMNADWKEERKQYDEKSRKLLDRCALLEERAGIFQTVRPVYERAEAVPHSDEATIVDISEADAADRYDRYRQEIRDAYFSVTDKTLLSDLIAAQMALDDHNKQRLGMEVRKAERQVRDASIAATQKSWRYWAVAGVILLAVMGFQFFNLAGAMVGAVAATFWGLILVGDAGNLVKKAQKETVAALEKAKRDQQLQSLYPAVFSHGEFFNGVRDRGFDGRLARAEVARYMSEQGS